jgi:hypothetical protein
LKPVSTATVATVLPGPSSCASWSAAATGGAHSAAKRGQARARLFDQLFADSHVSAKGVCVVELIGVEGAGLLRQFFGASFHALVKLGHKLAVFGRKNLEVAAEETHGAQFFVGETVGRDGREAVSLNGADHGERGPGAASGPLDDAHAWTQLSALLSAFNHCQCHAIFVRTGGIVVFELYENLSHGRGYDFSQTYDRSISNRLQN